MALSGGVMKWVSEAPAELATHWFGGVVAFGACAIFVPKPLVAYKKGYQNGFRWLHASGTTIGGYTNGNGTFLSLRPVHPGGSNDFERVSLHVLPLAQGQRRA